MTSGEYVNIKKRDNDREEDLIPSSSSGRKPTHPDSQTGRGGNREPLVSAG
jgi:hypothetical protein